MSFKDYLNEMYDDVKVSYDDTRKTVTYEYTTIDGKIIKTTGIDKAMDNEELRNNWLIQAKAKIANNKGLIYKDGIYYMPATM
jgi:hypothetical protein